MSEPYIVVGLVILTANIIMWSLVLYWSREEKAAKARWEKKCSK